MVVFLAVLYSVEDILRPVKAVIPKEERGINWKAQSGEILPNKPGYISGSNNETDSRRCFWR